MPSSDSVAARRTRSASSPNSRAPTRPTPSCSSSSPQWQSLSLSQIHSSSGAAPSRHRPPRYRDTDDDPPAYTPSPSHRPHRQSRSRPRSSSTEQYTSRSNFLLTPATTPLPSSPSSPSFPIPTPAPGPKFPAKKSNSSPLLPSHPRPPYAAYTPPRMNNNTDSDDDGDGLIFTSWSNGDGSARTTTSLRTRIFGGVSGSREKLKGITTAPGQLGAGETETEADEPPKHLPTARIIPASAPLVPPHTIQHILFESSRLLAIVPAVFGTLYNVFCAVYPPHASGEQGEGGREAPERVDYLVSALWAILTGYQCLALATGLLTRWRLYYPPLPTLIRLLALQAICWPATHLTLSVGGYETRPVICWAIIGTTTCISRSVQIWVTSNLWWERDGEVSVGPSGGGHRGNSERERRGSGDRGSTQGRRGSGSGYWRRWRGGKWGGRRWDWGEVGIKCALPAGVVYFFMAWAEALRREWESSGGPC